ncbi:MAG: Crp/Fnr family transcriptional regulator [Anaerovoracaceae bacterium]
MSEVSSRMQHFPEDTVIIKEGEYKNEMYKIISGKVAVYLNYGKKDEYLLRILSESQCFGEVGILCQKPSIYTVVALYDAMVMRISEEELESFLQNNSQNALNIIKNLAREVLNLKCNLDMMIEELSKGSEEERIRAEKLKEKINQYMISNVAFTGNFDRIV